MYGLRSLAYIAKALSRPLASVERMAEAVFPRIERRDPWSPTEIERLKTYLGVCDVELIARIFGRSAEDVQAHIEEFDQNQTERPWTQEEIVDLKRMHGTRTDQDIARVFQRPKASVRAKAAELCLAKDKAFVRKLGGKKAATRMPRWSAEEIARLVEIYPTSSNLEIAQELDRSVKSVVSKAHNLGLRKDSSRLIEMGRENVALRYNKRKEGGKEEGN